MDVYTRPAVRFRRGRRAGQPRRAAQRSRMTRPSLIRRIQQLEKELQVRLFWRDSRTVWRISAGRARVPAGRARAALRADTRPSRCVGWTLGTGDGIRRALGRVSPLRETRRTRPPPSCGPNRAEAGARAQRSGAAHQPAGSGLPSAKPAADWMPTTARSWNSASERAPA
ncbi:helix-turn-helix domain-containing protein [Actinopolyspora saharensis]|uniref:helix-turn-helix domain-containing protein n=2 Tax=Actinopolyspora TaxID=1849 RepID=UPI003CCBFC03